MILKTIGHSGAKFQSISLHLLDPWINIIQDFSQSDSLTQPINLTMKRYAGISIHLVCFFCLFFYLLPFEARSQKPVQLNSGEILHAMKKLNVLGGVLYMAAHPDDENTRLLAYMAKDRQLKTGYMAMTRGDGGQNLIGNEQGTDLGLIRTQELLAARRIDGAEQFFSRAFDFGFSKSTDEALSVWDKEKILSDAVWVIRNFRPDIIITRFPEDSRAGHGHHSGSAVIAREAFIAAADPKRFPEQFQYGVSPWKVRRIMWNTFSFGSTNTTAENQMKIDDGSYIPLLGKSIGEIAAESRSQHRSQGFGSASSRGSSIEYFTHVLGEKAEKDPMEGIDVSWNRVEGGAEIGSMVQAMINGFNMNEPVASIPQLIAIRKAVEKLNDAHWRRIKLQEIDRLIQMTSGLFMEALSDRLEVKQGDTLKVNIGFNNRSSAEISLTGVNLDGMQIEYNSTLNKNQNWTRSIDVPIAKERTYTQPYWLVNPMNKGSFNVTDQRAIGMAQNKPTFSVEVQLNVLGNKFIYDIPVMYREVDPAKGEFFSPAIIAPANTISSAPKPVLVNSSTSRSAVSTNVNEKGNSFATLKTRIHYEHIPTITYFNKVQQQVINLDLKTTGKKIGYIVGAGDKVMDMIELMGYQVTPLGKDDITAEKLKQFDAVIVGVRAYNVHDWMNEKYDLLMNYIDAGGNMVVQYNTNSFAGPLAKMKIGPKPFMISRGRITDEESDVVFLDPKDPLLNYPNKITSNDFSNWIQERGIYFADEFGQDYKPILSMHDKGESDLKGGLIVRNQGKGRFIYTGLVFFRELPAGVPGAIRLFANLISNPNLKINE
jgi:LmbE family N-acetylglucosaminyl deacetylase